jgi:polyphosphate kinase
MFASSSKRACSSTTTVTFAPGLKIHAKLFLISRKEGDDVVRYAHIGTGNFNEVFDKVKDPAHFVGNAGVSG